MKKKFLYGILFLVLMFTAFVPVKALDSDKLPTPAKNMTYSPKKGDRVYAIADTYAFDDFATNVKFTAKTGTDMITPKTGQGAKKILISLNPKFENALATGGSGLNPTAKGVDLKGDADDWFTAYCLNGGLKFPQYSVFNFSPQTALTNLLTATYEGNVQKIDKIVGGMAIMAALNNSKLGQIFSSAVDYNTEIGIVYGFVGGTSTQYLYGGDMLYNSPTQLDSTWNINPGADELNLANDEYAAATKVSGQAKVILKEIQFIKVGSEGTQVKSFKTEDFIGVDPTNKDDNGNYVLKFNYEDILLDSYYVDDTKDTSAYRHSLWIIEHSYPSMTIDDFLALVAEGDSTFTRAALETQIKSLYSGENFDTEAGKTLLDSLVDGYLYETVQYALWYANDSFESNGKRLGTELHLGTLGKENMLHKIYSFLIRPRDEYATYGKDSYNRDDLKVDMTNNDKVVEKDDSYVYGPYTVRYNVMNPSDISYEITSNNKDAVSVVDADGKVLDKIANGGEFYVKCKKSGKVTNVKIKFSATGTTYAKNGKGHIYYANYINQQNVITGFKYENVNKDIEQEFTYNPKTGVPNIAIVFVITLIAFSLGYLALSYNNKSMELN